MDAYLEVHECLLSVRLICAETLQYDCVCALAEHLDLAIGAPDDRGHPFPRGVELAHVEDLILQTRTSNVDENRLRFAGLCAHEWAIR